MSASLYRCPVFLLLVSAACFPAEVSANSYAFSGLPEKWVPREIQSFAVWRNRYSEKSLKMTPGMLERFLEKGAWSFHSPELDLRKKVEQPAERFQFDNDPEYHKALRDYALEIATIRAEYDSLRGGVEGAIHTKLPVPDGPLSNPEGHLVLWSLRSPRVLRLEWGGFLCHLTLEKENALILEKREISDDPAPKPRLPEGTWNIGRDFLPGTGFHQVLSSETIGEFEKNGRVIEVFERRRHFERGITTHWFKKDPWTPFPKDFPRDQLGNPIVGGRHGGSFACIFLDQAGKLWRAELLTDCHLRLEDAQGRLLVLEHSKLLEKGHGQPMETEEIDPCNAN